MIVSSVVYNPELGPCEDRVLDIYDDFSIWFYYNLHRSQYIIVNNKIEISDNMLNSIALKLYNEYYGLKFNDYDYYKKLHKLWSFDLGGNYYILTSFKFSDSGDLNLSVNEFIIKGIIE